MYDSQPLGSSNIASLPPLDFVLQPFESRRKWFYEYLSKEQELESLTRASVTSTEDEEALVVQRGMYPFKPLDHISPEGLVKSRNATTQLDCSVCLYVVKFCYLYYLIKMPVHCLEHLSVTNKGFLWIWFCHEDNYLLNPRVILSVNYFVIWHYIYIYIIQTYFLYKNIHDWN